MIETKFKQSEVGLIPEDWEVKRLGDLCKVNGRIGFRGYTKADLVSPGMGAFTIGGKHITHNILDLSEPDFISWEKYYESPEIMVHKGDIVMAQRGTLGRAAHIEEEIGPATINPSLVLLNKIKCNDKFMHFILSSERCSEAVINNGSQTSVPMISQAQIERIELQMPPTITEQSLIAEALSDMDDLIATTKKFIEKKRNIKEGAMQDLLSGKRRLPGFKETWKERKLDEVLSYEQPTNYLVSSTEYVECGTPVLTAGKTFLLGYTWENYGIFNKLPVIIFDDFVTESKYVDFPFKVKSSAMKMLRLRDERNCLKVIFEIMQQIRFTMTEHKRYWISDYSKLKIQIPSYEEQIALNKVISDFDSEVSSLEARLTKYQSLKQGMMQQLLTGKIRLI